MHLPPPIKAPREHIIRHLKAGHGPKQIAYLLNVSVKCVQKILAHELEARKAYIDSYPLRYPNRENPPTKILAPLKLIVG